MFTTNRAQAAPILVSRRQLEASAGRASAIVVNSGCANACTGPDGLKHAAAMAEETAAALACEGSGVRVVAVNVGESAETIAAFEAEQPIVLPALRDPDGRTWRRFARGLPANLLWTPAGQRSEVGPLDEAAWRAKLANLGCSAAPS